MENPIPSMYALPIFMGAVAVLIIASMIGWVLKLRFAPEQPHAVIDNLNSRIRAWWWMVGVLAAAFWFDKQGVIILFALLFVVFQAVFAWATPFADGIEAGQGRRTTRSRVYPGIAPAQASARSSPALRSATRSAGSSRSREAPSSPSTAVSTW